MAKSFWVALAAVVAVGAVVVLLWTGGATAPSGEDARGDVAVGPEASPPQNPALADLVGSDVAVSGGEARFEVTLGTDVPDKLRDGSLTLRWDLIVEGVEAWIVEIDLNVAMNAALTSQQTNYGSSTVDETLPGEVQVEGDTLTLTFQTAGIKRFPSEFEWRLTSELDGSLEDVESALATDSLPNSGTAELAP